MITLLSRYKEQRREAAKRNIGFELSFDDWLHIWKKSGKLSKRGCKSGQYCMSRYGDKGSYKIGNVRIIPIEKNISEAHKGKKISIAHKIKLSEFHTGQKASKETKERMSVSHKGLKHSASAKVKISKGNRKAWANGGSDAHRKRDARHSVRMKKIMKNGNVIRDDFGRFITVGGY